MEFKRGFRHQQYSLDLQKWSRAVDNLLVHLFVICHPAILGELKSKSFAQTYAKKNSHRSPTKVILFLLVMLLDFNWIANTGTVRPCYHLALKSVQSLYWRQPCSIRPRCYPQTVKMMGFVAADRKQTDTLSVAILLSWLYSGIFLIISMPSAHIPRSHQFNWFCLNTSDGSLMGAWVSSVAKQQINWEHLHLQLLPNKHSQRSLFNSFLWLSSEPQKERNDWINHLKQSDTCGWSWG